MSLPQTRDDFKEFCLRRLGKPVIEINVSDEQVEDCVDTSLQMFQDYHFDGTQLLYFKYQLSNTDITNQYIQLPDNIIGAVRMFPVGDPSIRVGDIFNIRYQIALNDLYTLTSVSMVPYYMVMQNLGLITEMLVGQQPIRYNRHMNTLYLDMDWTAVAPGNYILVECYSVIDPDVYPKMWTDRWLALYCTALIKKIWGNNLKKYDGIELPGGVKFSGQKIYDEAVQELDELTKEVINTYSIPAMPLIG